jgi:hypothetical protein
LLFLSINHCCLYFFLLAAYRFRAFSNKQLLAKLL